MSHQSMRRICQYAQRHNAENSPQHPRPFTDVVVSMFFEESKRTGQPLTYQRLGHRIAACDFGEPNNRLTSDELRRLGRAAAKICGEEDRFVE